MVNPAEREGSTHPLDERVWKRVEEQCSKNLKKGDFLIRDLFESFPIYARRINLARFLARYELFRVVKDLPGCVLECGVYRGAGLLTWAKLAEIFCTGDRTKKLSALIILKDSNLFIQKMAQKCPNGPKWLEAGTPQIL